jgi:esterase/lipase superfamily enzyme
MRLMSDLHSRILALADDVAIVLLRRLTQALATGSMNASSVQRNAQELAIWLSLPSEPAVSLQPGEVARSALLLLTSDERFAPSIARLMDLPRETFMLGAATAIDETDLLSVLQTQIPAANGEGAAALPSGAASQPGLMRLLARQLLGMVKLQPTHMQADAEYQVWFATSRRPLNAVDSSPSFGTERDTCIHYGHCRVFVPRSHQVGSTGSGWWKRTLLQIDDRLKLLSVTPQSSSVFWRQFHQQLAESVHDERDAVVFIHGYNVSFNEAALRAAQIGFDLQVRGAMAFYSWASRGTLAGYAADEAAIELDEKPIADFLCDMALRSGARKVHVIAHSMGNRVVLRAMDQIARQAEKRSGVRFGQVILAAADVDTRKFNELCSAYGQLSERTTLYVSTRDLAIESSRWLHDFPRAGLMPPVTIASGIDTINAANTDLTLMGHGYVAEAKDVMSDIHALIHHGAAPQQRFGLRATRTPQGAPYWLVGA